MNELRNGWPSMVPATLTRPRVPKNSTESGITTYVQPPGLGLLTSVAVNCRSSARGASPALDGRGISASFLLECRPSRPTEEAELIGGEMCGGHRSGQG